MKFLKIACVVTAAIGITATYLFAEDAASPQGDAEGNADKQNAKQTKDRKVAIIREASQPDGFPKPTAVGEIVVKDYPKYRAARVDSEDGRQNSMFNTLFRHIQSNNIKMTAPVEMTFGDDAPDSMMFLYQSTDLGDLGDDGAVAVIDIEPMKVISLGLRGSYNAERFHENVKELEAWLSENSDQWQAAGEPRYMGFNTPFVPSPLRYGEIQIPIKSAAD